MQLFLLFDLKQNNIIEFGEFVRALSVFHPQAPLEEKANCAPHSFADPPYLWNNFVHVWPGCTPRGKPC